MLNYSDPWAAHISLLRSAIEAMPDLSDGSYPVAAVLEALRIPMDRPADCSAGHQSSRDGGREAHG